MSLGYSVIHLRRLNRRTGKDPNVRQAAGVRLLRTYGNHFRHYHWSHRWCYRQVPHARKGSRWLDYHDLNRFSWLFHRNISRTSSWSVSRGRACGFYWVNRWRDDPSVNLPTGRQTTHVKPPSTDSRLRAAIFDVNNQTQIQPWNSLPSKTFTSTS